MDRERTGEGKQGKGREGGDIPNKTLAATQQLQMNNGLLLPTQPISLPFAISATIALVALRHVAVYGS